MIEQLLSQKIGALHLELAQTFAEVERLKRFAEQETKRADTAERKLSELSTAMGGEHANDRAA